MASTRFRPSGSFRCWWPWRPRAGEPRPRAVGRPGSIRRGLRAQPGQGHLTGLYGPDSDGGQREPASGQSALFAFTVNGNGALVPGTAVLSSCAWAVSRALSTPDAPPLAGFGQDAAQFARGLARLAGADDEAASLLLAGGPLDPVPAVVGPPDGEPDEVSGDADARPAPGLPQGAAGQRTDREPRPLRGEDLRRFAARLGVTQALGPRGLRVRTDVRARPDAV